MAMLASIMGAQNTIYLLKEFDRYGVNSTQNNNIVTIKQSLEIFVKIKCI